MTDRNGEHDVSTRDCQSDSEHSDSEKRKYYISQSLFESLQAKGFSENAIKKSIVAGCVDEGTCTQWITMHEDHPELNTPLEEGVEVVVRVKRVLTEAEREAKVQELRGKARAKMEEEKRQALEDERKRVSMGRKAIEVKEELDKIRREAELEAVRKQKQQDLAARRRVRIQILTDKFIREGSMPEEARRKAEEEIEEEARKKREQALAQVDMEQRQHGTSQTGTAPTVWNLQSLAAPPPVSLDEVFTNEPPMAASSLPELAAAVANFNDAVTAQQCLKMLRTILTNIRDNPFDTSKRLLKTSTNAFCTKLAPVRPALQLLRVCGFRLGVDFGGNEVITATTMVVRVVNRALAALSSYP
ncbi:PUB domain containing protein, putative [Trypanosoma equiperdum]|uniref:PUB domain-containing protein n=3 Tax=Trypanozoon TaxID=39700 RepID=Q4FKP7_TRYB2|nr:PUB domain containing protein [Trypanosoma brucei equiperdum]CAJ16752.1 hypothetical protein, conserved [Trypanosoma brucei brucei TREU927]SCU67407.1 PUB domain containing protein, putative [Trypanosoma equiperdum]